MSIKYTTVKFHNPQGEEGVTYYRPRAVKTGDYSSEELERDINDATSVSDVDVHAVLFALNKQLRKSLLDGRTIVLDGIGRISVGMETESFTDKDICEDGFTPSKYVKSLHLNFLPSASIKKELKSKSAIRHIEGKEKLKQKKLRAKS